MTHEPHPEPDLSDVKVDLADDAFEAARERGDVVVRGSALYIRLFGSPALN